MAEGINVRFAGALQQFIHERMGVTELYLRSLIVAIQALPSQRHRKRTVTDKALRGVWQVRHEHHFLFCRE